MIRSFALLIAASLAISLGSAQTPAVLAAQLRTLADTPDISKSLPASWHVHTQDGDFDISAAPLRFLLDAHRPANAQSWLRFHADQLSGYDSLLPPVGDARSVLQRILARPEFAPPPPRNAWQRARDRFNAWIYRLFLRIVGSFGGHPITGNIVFWAALAGAVALLAYWLVTMLRDNLNSLKLTGSPLPAAAGSWDQWIVAMRDAADRGDLRKAIQCAYWAGLTRLQASAILPAAAEKTPREYLRLLTAISPAIGPLRALTDSLERFWYGCAAAAPADLSACLTSLKDLGCKLD